MDLASAAEALFLLAAVQSLEATNPWLAKSLVQVAKL